MKLILHFDGSCTSNPGGKMGFGWHLDTDSGVKVAEDRGAVEGYCKEEMTSNVAEFEALLAGLEWIAAYCHEEVDMLSIHGDSQLVVNIVRGDWKAKKPHIKLLADACKEVVKTICVKQPTKIELKWIPREQNSRADSLADVHG